MRMVRGLTALAGLVLVAGAAACGSGPATPAASGSAEPAADITVGVIPIVDVAPIYLGIKQGFFREQNLNVTPKLAQGGAAIIPAVVSGDYQFGFSNNVSLLLATGQGLKLKIVSQGTQAGSDPNSDSWAILVKGGSQIAGCKDLEGRTIAVNTLKNIGEISVKAACDRGGVDVSRFKLIEMNFPDMLPALNRGQIDAMWTAEPFTTQARQGGATVLSYNMVATEPHLSVASYFTSEAYAKQNAGIVKRFITAINKSLDYATAHVSEMRAVVNTYAKISDSVLAAMTLPYYSHDLNKPSVEKLAGLMVKYGMLSTRPSLKNLYYS